MEAQLDLFQATDVERAVWRQLPEEACEKVGELFASLLLKHVEGQVRDDR